MAQLAPLTITPPPGVVKTESNLVVAGRWTDCDKIRSRRGRPEKLGGWVRVTTTPTVGLPRTMHGWRDLLANEYIAVGTYKKLYAYDTVLAQNDITPYRSTGTLGANPFTTALNSPIVSVADNGHGLSAGDVIVYSGATAVGGITPNGTFTVLLVTNANAYSFVFTSNATSGATGGGASVAFKYEVPVGTELATQGLGWGVGAWGLGTWGTARSNSTIIFEPRVWTLDHFGKILLASFNGGSVYSFDPSQNQPWPRAAAIAGAPTDCRAIFVTPEEFVFALREAMTVSACSQGDYTDWTPSSSNTAFSRVLTEGTRLVAGRVLAPFVSLVWTDAAVYSFQYTGSQFVYNSSLIAKDCGLISPNAAITVNGVAYWMGPNNLFMFNGSVAPMPNVEDIRRYLYDQLPDNVNFQCFAVYNPIFNEIYFGWMGEGDLSPTRYVIYSIDDQAWWPGYLTRCSGTHFTQGDTRPYFADSDGYIYQHENTRDANGVAMPCTLTLSPYAMADGLKSMDMEGMIPDFFQQSGDVTMQLNTWDRLSDAVMQDSETDVIIDTESAALADIRLSGRYIGGTFSQDALDSYFRWGKPTAFIRPTGGRR